MPTDIAFDPNKYISSKRASEITGYAQDYIGQLARGAQIDARRVGGLWYISIESLSAYKNKADDFKPIPPVHDGIAPVNEGSVIFDGKEYISANRASKITGYNQDYIGQLARSGKVVSRQVGNRWYVDKDLLLAHQEEKNALLAAVQAESVGITSNNAPTESLEPDKDEIFLTYTNDEGDLLPRIAEKEKSDSQTLDIHAHVIPIRVIGTRQPIKIIDTHNKKNRVRLHGNTMRRAIFPAVALTVVIVLSFGLISLKDSSSYTQISTPSSVMGRLNTLSLVANATSNFDSLTSFIENLLTAELVYQRVQ